MSATADALLARLDAAPDDVARASLLGGVPPQVLEELHAALGYRAFLAETSAAVAAERAAFAAFTGELDSAPDDATRLQVIEACRCDPQRGPAFLSEWAWQRRATDADWAARYMEEIRRPARSSPAANGEGS